MLLVRKILSIVVLLSFQLSFSQSKFEKMPEGTNEIHFTYKQNSKIFIDESGVYADSLFFKKNFPKMKVINVIDPATYYLNTKADLKSFRSTNKHKLTSILYHLNERYKAVHFVGQNKSIIKAVRDDASIKEIFQKYFRKDYSLFNYKIEIYYDTQVKHLLYPMAYYQFSFDEIQKNIVWISSTRGKYIEQSKKKKEDYVNVITFDENLPKVVSMGFVLENSNLGVSKVESIESILELTEVKYK